MQHVETLLLFLTITCVLFLFIGLVKPWAMLWWEDVQNRSKVIRIYGSLSIGCAVVYYIVKTFYHSA